LEGLQLPQGSTLIDNTGSRPGIDHTINLPNNFAIRTEDKNWSTLRRLNGNTYVANYFDATALETQLLKRIREPDFGLCSSNRLTFLVLAGPPPTKRTLELCAENNIVPITYPRQLLTDEDEEHPDFLGFLEVVKQTLQTTIDTLLSKNLPAREDFKHLPQDVADKLYTVIRKIRLHRLLKPGPIQHVTPRYMPRINIQRLLLTLCNSIIRIIVERTSSSTQLHHSRGELDTGILSQNFRKRSGLPRVGIYEIVKELGFAIYGLLRSGGKLVVKEGYY